MPRNLTTYTITLYSNAKLTDRGAEEEYEQVEEMTNDLRKWLVSNVPPTTSKIVLNHDGFPITIELG